MLCKRIVSYCTYTKLKRLRCPYKLHYSRSSSNPRITQACFKTSVEHTEHAWRQYAGSKSLGKAQQVASEGHEMSHEESPIATAVAHADLMSALQNCSSVQEQMMELCSILRLTPEDIKTRLTLCDMVEDMFRPFFSNFKVQLFGSSVNSFGFKGCDIDMAFNTGTRFEDFMSASTDDSYIPSIVDLLEGGISKEYMDKLAPKDQLIFMHTVFLDYYKESKTAPLFINAYVPIIRFNHDRYQLKCDLSCGNWSAIVNTKLLYAFNEIDERVAPLVMAIRYWGKHCGLIGGGLMFNTYCITLLVIYFLQTRTPPVLPSVDYIISQSESLKSNIVLDENVLPEIKKIPKSKNTQTVEELFRDFFFFYLYFDFSRVICTKTATSAPRDSFAGNKRFRLNTICVQDPIKLSHNVANLVDYRNCRKFAKEMLYASKLFQDKSIWSPKPTPWGLIALLDKPVPLHLMIADNCSWTIDLPVKLCSSVPLSSKNQPLLEMADTVIRVLEHGLLFKCKVIDLEDASEDSLETSQLKPFLRATCYGEHNTWLGRNSVDIKDLQMDSAGNALDVERLVSLQLTKKKSDEKKTVFKFLCDFYVLEIHGETFLRVSLSSDSEHNLNPILGVFLKEYLPYAVMKLKK